MHDNNPAAPIERHPDFEPVGVLDARPQAVAALRAAGLDWDAAALQRFLGRAGAVGIVLRDGRSLSRRPVAVLLAYARRTTTLKHLAVVPAHRRRGAAKYLLRLLDRVPAFGEGGARRDGSLVAHVPDVEAHVPAMCLRLGGAADRGDQASRDQARRAASPASPMRRTRTCFARR